MTSASNRLRVLVLIGLVAAGAIVVLRYRGADGVEGPDTSPESRDTSPNAPSTPVVPTEAAPTPELPTSAATRPAVKRSVDDERVLNQLKELCPNLPDEQLDWLANHYGNTAINVARVHGQQGLEVLYYLGKQGLVVMREMPKTFDALQSRLGGRAAAAFLVYMEKNFLTLAELGGLPRLLDRIAKLSPTQKKLAQQYPATIPFLLLAPADVERALIYPDLCLACFSGLDLSNGPEGLKQVCGLITRFGPKARPWVKARGLDGLLLLESFSAFLGKAAPGGVGLPTLLAMLAANQGDLAPRMAEGKASEVWDALSTLIRADQALEPNATDGKPRRGDWIDLACRDPHTIRLILEHGTEAMAVLVDVWPQMHQTGASLPSLLYEGYASSGTLPDLTAHAWDALQRRPEDEKATAASRQEAFQVLLLMGQPPSVDFLAYHPRSDRFRRLLDTLDGRVVACLGDAENMQSDVENQYALLEDRGIDQLDEFDKPPSLLKQTLPFYDSARLVWLLAHGYAPTRGEILFAGVDVAFTVWDIATLGAGAPAAATVEAGIKTTGKAAARKTLEKIAEETAEKAIEATAKKTGRAMIARVVEAMESRLASTARVAEQLAKRNLVKDLGTAVALAARSAARLKIPLVHVATKQLGKLLIRDWAFNLGTARGLGWAAEHAVTKDSPWANKAAQVLRYLNSQLGAPITAP